MLPGNKLFSVWGLGFGVWHGSGGGNEGDPPTPRLWWTGGENGGWSGAEAEFNKPLSLVLSPLSREERIVKRLIKAPFRIRGFAYSGYKSEVIL